MDEILKDFGGTVWYGLRLDWWRAHETSAFKTWKGIIARAEEACKTEGEEIGRVAGTREGIAGDLKLVTANRNEDFGLEELRYEARKTVKLCIGIELDIVSVVFWNNVVPYLPSVRGSATAQSIASPCRCLHISANVSGSRSMKRVFVGPLLLSSDRSWSSK